jgi:mevalonate kinase
LKYIVFIQIRNKSRYATIAYMKSSSVTVPGKIHLLGEHAVVYGKPSILTTVGLRATITVIPRNDVSVTIKSSQFHTIEETTLDHIKIITDEARYKWIEFSKTNNTELLKELTKGSYTYPMICIGETLEKLEYWKIGKGFDLTIQSDIPFGSGMGSSALISVGIAGVLFSSLGLSIKKEKKTLSDIAFLCEQRKHGFPSGGDPAIVQYGGLLWYRKETEDLRIIESISYTIPDSLCSKFVLIDTGKPKETTGEMVSLVRHMKDTHSDIFNNFLETHEKLVRELLGIIKVGDLHRFCVTIQEGEKNLESIGVVSESVKKLIRDIESSGGAAKICGGGGKIKGTGIVLGIHKNPEKIITIAKKYSYPTFQTELGGEGIRVID